MARECLYVIYVCDVIHFTSTIDILKFVQNLNIEILFDKIVVDRKNVNYRLGNTQPF